jgi:hypothetical protein
VRQGRDDRGPGALAAPPVTRRAHDELLAHGFSIVVLPIGRGGIAAVAGAAGLFSIVTVRAAGLVPTDLAGVRRRFASDVQRAVAGAQILDDLTRVPTPARAVLAVAGFGRPRLDRGFEVCTDGVVVVEVGSLTRLLVDCPSHLARDEVAAAQRVLAAAAA